MRYGLKCPCHGVRLYDTERERDKYAITFQCRQEWFRIVQDGDGEVPPEPDLSGWGSLRGPVGWAYNVLREDGTPTES